MASINFPTPVTPSFSSFNILEVTIHCDVSGSTIIPKSVIGEFSVGNTRGNFVMDQAALSGVNSLATLRTAIASAAQTAATSLVS